MSTPFKHINTTPIYCLYIIYSISFNQTRIFIFKVGLELEKFDIKNQLHQTQTYRTLSFRTSEKLRKYFIRIAYSS